MSLFRRKASILPASTRRQEAWQRAMVARAEVDGGWSPADAIWEARLGYEPIDSPESRVDPVTGERVSPAVRILPPEIGSRMDASVHNGKIRALVRDYPSLRDRRIAGLAYEFEPPEPDHARMLFGPWHG